MVSPLPGLHTEAAVKVHLRPIIVLESDADAGAAWERALSILADLLAEQIIAEAREEVAAELDDAGEPPDGQAAASALPVPLTVIEGGRP